MLKKKKKRTPRFPPFWWRMESALMRLTKAMLIFFSFCGSLFAAVEKVQAVLCFLAEQEEKGALNELAAS